MHTLTCDSVLCVCVCLRAKGSGTDGVSCMERFGGQDQFPWSWRESILVHCTGSFEVFMHVMNITISGELIVSRYVAESITMIAGRFGHVGLCQLRTKLKKLQRETSYIAITGQWCGVIKSGCLSDQ